MEEKIRLGGMALANGVLVHGPTVWAVAVRTADGELKVASERKRLRGAERRRTRSCVARCGSPRSFALLPRVRRAAARGAPALRAARGARRDGRERGRRARAARSRRASGPRRRSSSAASLSLAPATLALRGSRPRRLPRRRAHLDRHLRARRAARQGARALRLAPDRAARSLTLGGRGRARGARRRAPARPARVGGRGRRARRPRPRSSRWMARHPEHPPLARARVAGPRAPAPARDRRADARAARGRRGRARARASSSNGDGTMALIQQTRG